jgi:hypothetical protein
MLPELPGEVHDKPDHSKGNQYIEGCYNIVIANAPRDNSAANHDSNIGYEKGKYAENSEHVENLLLVHLFCWFGTGRKEKDQVSHQKEAGQVYQVTCFDKDG